MQGALSQEDHGGRAARHAGSEMNQEVVGKTHRYRDLGFSVLKASLPPDLAAQMLASFESDLPKWAADCKLEMETYLTVVNKWSHWNDRVATMTETIAPILRPQVGTFNLWFHVQSILDLLQSRTTNPMISHPTLQKNMGRTRMKGTRAFCR